jgi:hypothetical protein
MSTPESLSQLKSWVQFERFIRDEVWGRAVGRLVTPQESYEAGRIFEEYAVDHILPHEGYEDIIWLSKNSRSFPIDVVATSNGKRILIEVSSDVGKPMAKKMWFVTAMQMPVQILHIAPKDRSIYFIQSILTPGLYSNVPASFLHGLAVKKGIKHEYLSDKCFTCEVCGARFTKFGNTPRKVCSDNCKRRFLSLNAKTRGVIPPYLTDAVGSERRGAKLTEQDVVQIRKMSKDGTGARKIAASFGVCTTSIRNIKDGKTWAHVRD